MAVVCACIYQPCLKGGFVWDDADIYIVENRLLRESDGLRRFWFTTEPEDYYPLTYTTFWIEFRLFGLSPTGYHVDNLILHVANCLLAWRLAIRLGVAHAWLAAMLFAVHPVGVEAVAWIAQRKTLLATSFALLTTLSFQRSMEGGGWKSAAAALLWFFASLASKPSTIALPVVLFGWSWLMRGEGLRTAMLRVLPLVAVAALMGWVGLWFQQNRVIGDAVVRDQSLVDRLATGAIAAWFYLGKAFLPLEVCFIYPRWQLTLKDPLAWVAVAAWPLLLAAAWAVERRRTFAALAAYLLLLAPVLGLVDVYFWRYSFVADHYQYASLAVLALWLGSVRPTRPAVDRAFAAGLLCIAAFWALAARGSAGVYTSEETVWRDVLKKNPDAWICHGNLVRILFSQGKSAEAERHYNELKRLTSGDVQRLLAAAEVAAARGDFAASEKLSRRVLQFDPLDEPANRRLAFLTAKRGDWRAALSHARRVRNPDSDLLELVEKALAEGR